MSGITFIRPRLAGLSGKGPLNQNLKTLHRAVRERFPYVHRIAVALYDAQTHRINTYLASGDEGKPLAHYQSTLPEAVSLKKVLRERRIRVVDDLNAFEGSHRNTRNASARWVTAPAARSRWRRGEKCAGSSFSTRGNGRPLKNGTFRFWRPTPFWPRRWRRGICVRPA